MPYDKLALGEILLQSDCRTLDSRGKILPPSNAIYGVIAERLALRGSHIDPKHIYTIINQDRNGFRTQIATFYKLDTTFSKDESNTVNSSSAISYGSNTSHLLDKTQPQSKKIKLVLSYEKWLEIKPKKIMSSGRAYWKFQNGWADVVAERVCHQHKTIDCIFVQKSSGVSYRNSKSICMVSRLLHRVQSKYKGIFVCRAKERCRRDIFMSNRKYLP